MTPNEIADETGWLIEHSGALPGFDTGVISWACIRPKAEGFGAKEFGFTNDANKAVRFARKEDAEAVLSLLLGAEPPEWYSKPYSVGEHMWPAPDAAMQASTGADTDRHAQDKPESLPLPPSADPAGLFITEGGGGPGPHNAPSVSLDPVKGASVQTGGGTLQKRPDDLDRAVAAALSKE